MFKKITIFFLAALALYVTRCAKTPSGDDVVVATIGDNVITVGDFKMNYEFGLSHLKKGDDPKRAYLDLMINEELLSQQGYRLGLDKAEPVQKAVQRLADELLIEELFIDEVHSKITVSDDEIRDALNKSKLSWKFRYWVEPTFEGAAFVADAMRQRGYSEVVEDFLRASPETPLSPSHFESDYVTWLDVPEELFNGIKDLPRGDISDPIEMNGVFYIVQITDIRRQGILENEYADKAASMKKTLFYRKVMEEGFKFVSEYLTPKEIVTKGDPFRILANALAEWKKSGEEQPFVEAVKSASEEQKALFALQKELDETLVQFKGGDWSVEKVVSEKLDAAELTADPDDRTAFRNQLNNMIGLSIRNYFLLKEARDRKLDKSENLRSQLQAWQDKWVFQETRYNYTKDFSLAEDELRTWFDANKQRYKIRKDKEPTYSEFKKQVKQDAYRDHARKILITRIDSLSQFVPVSINDAVLDTITVNESKKSKWMSVQLFKRSSNRLLFPIVDPAWGF